MGDLFELIRYTANSKQPFAFNVILEHVREFRFPNMPFGAKHLEAGQKKCAAVNKNTNRSRKTSKSRDTTLVK